jgi:hypothetical protein
MFLTSELDGVARSALRPKCFKCDEREPDTRLLRGWVGPRSGIHTEQKRKYIPLPKTAFQFFDRLALNLFI